MNIKIEHCCTVVRFCKYLLQFLPLGQPLVKIPNVDDEAKKPMFSKMTPGNIDLLPLVF